MPDAAVETGWSTCHGCCWDYVQHQKKRRECQQLKQPMVTLWCCPVSYSRLHVLPRPPPRAPQAAPVKVEIPSTIKPAKEAEKARVVGVQEASHVYMREGAVIGPLDATYRGPYHVLVREKKKLLLEIGATRTWVSVDRLKPHVGMKSPEAAQPPTRGRPRKKAP